MTISSFNKCIKCGVINIMLAIAAYNFKYAITVLLRFIKTFTDKFTCHFCLFRYSVCQRKSKAEIQKGTNSIRINVLLACKRCPLSLLLTPF